MLYGGAFLKWANWAKSIKKLMLPTMVVARQSNIDISQVQKIMEGKL